MKIYLAGPDVFRPDAPAYGATLKAWCAGHGFEGLFPLDAPALPGDGAGAAHAIRRANLALIDGADALMANLNPFRGHEPDSGTAFEVGYATARGLPVWGYASLADPMVRRLNARPAAAGHVDEHGWHVEDFGLPLNLMLACSVHFVHGDARACLQRMAAHYTGLAPVLETR